MKKALGKGLSALIPDTYVNEKKPEPEAPKAPQSPSAPSIPSAPKTSIKIQKGFEMIALSKIQANQEQPRKEFAPEKIEELAASIREKGILQPIIVAQTAANEYSVVCGERRLRAAKLCGLSQVPAVVKELAKEDFLEWALIENIQREDLNPIEEAEAYRKLGEERMCSQEDIAKRVGKDRSTVTNSLRLLRLPPEIQDMLRSGFLTMGHARALLGMMSPEHQRQLAKRIAEENLSVRQVETIVNRSNAHKRKPKQARHLKPEIIDLENRIGRHLGTQVKIYPRKNQQQGRLEVHYYSLDDLERILEQIRLPEEG